MITAAYPTPGTIRQLSICARLLVAVVCCVAVIGTAQAETRREYLIKAAFLYNFATFVEWPTDAFTGADDPIVFCIDGDAAFEAANDALTDKSVNDRKIRVVKMKNITQPPLCHILFLSAQNSSPILNRDRAITAHSTLIVSDRPEIAEIGGIVNLVIVDNKIRFDVNLPAARRARLQISARLLKLARSVSK
jgi:hypothetical protein